MFCFVLPLYRTARGTTPRILESKKAMASLEEQFFDDFESSEDEAPNKEETKEETKEENCVTLPEFRKELDDVLAQLDSLEGTDSKSVRTSEDYAFVSRKVALIAKLDLEMSLCHRYLREVYGHRFPELETVILNGIDYARVVIHAGEALDFSTIDFSSILPAGSVITVQVTAATTKGAALSSAQHTRAQTLAKTLLEYDSIRTRVLKYVESRAEVMAPNLTAVVGASIAASLLGIAGGIKQLAAMPSCNLKVVGKTVAILAGASTQTARPHEGIVYSAPLVKRLPKHLRAKGGQVISGKATLAARIDCALSGKKDDGKQGRIMHDALEKKFEVWMAPNPAKTLQPLPIPGGDENKKRHRAGRRARKEKERMGISEMRKLANRVKFGEAPEQGYGNDLETDGLGMLGQEGSSKLRVQPKKTDTLSIAAARKIAKTKRHERRNKASQSSSAANGFATSLAFSSVQGMELGAMTPAPGGVGLGSMDASDGTKSQYFDAETPFVSKAASSKRKK